MALVDEELKQHLTEIAGFTPCDQWQHIIYNLRKGHWYFVWRRRNRPPVLRLIYKSQLVRTAQAAKEVNNSFLEFLISKLISRS